MSWKLRSALATGLAATVCATLAAGGRADGLPVPFDAADNAGVTVPGHPYSYATAGAGGDTAVVRIARGTGEIQGSTELAGTYGVPLVAYDGTPSGLSADGERLILIRPRTRFPRAETSFARIETERMRVLEEITLRGDFSFDALSPDGETMYLIRYSDPRDPTAYEVRAYDLERGRLLGDPIIDPDESGEEMAGFPQTRAVGPGGRWAYTLYSRAERDRPPFIHALDTQRGTAVCIDLDLLEGERRIDLLSLQPSLDGESLGVVARGEPVATVDLSSFEVSEAAPPASDPTSAEDEQGSVPWLLIAGALAIVAVAGSAAALRRRRARHVYHDELERLSAIEDATRAEEDARECEPVR